MPGDQEVPIWNRTTHLRRWSEVTLSWHADICSCNEPWEHLKPCFPGTGGGGSTGDRDGGDPIDDLLLAAAMDAAPPAGGATGPSNGEETTVDGMKNCTSGPHLR